MGRASKYIMISTILLCGCKSSEKKCDAYGNLDNNIIVFPEMHTHDLYNNKWSCNEFPSDTLNLNEILISNK